MHSMILIGAASALVAAVLFALLVRTATTAELTGIYMFFAAAQGFTVGNIMTNGLRSLPDALNADGNAVFSTLQQLAGAIGTSVVSTIVAAAQQKYPDDMAAGTMCGTQNAFVLLLAMSAVMAFCAVMAVRRSKT